MGRTALLVSRARFLTGKRWWALSVPLFALLLFSSGCITGSLSTPDRISTLHLISTSLALDFDGKPGADGVGVRLYAAASRTSEPVHIRTGTLELMVFDGALQAEEIATREPMKSWSYRSDELRQHEQETSVGVSYAFLPMWEVAPQRNRVTVLARYTATPGKTIYSAPISVPLAR